MNSSANTPARATVLAALKRFWRLTMPMTNILGFYSPTPASADLCPDTRKTYGRAGTPSRAGVPPRAPGDPSKAVRAGKLWRSIAASLISAGF
jgi:hypothetical protein